MAAPTPVLFYGATSLFLGEAPSITHRSDGFDEGNFLFHLGDRNSLKPNSSIPGYPSMFVVENQQTDHSGDFEHRVRAVGLESGSRRLINSAALDAEDSFDTGSETWIVPKGAKINYGTRHSEHARLYAVSIQAKRSPVSQYEILDVAFKGIKTGNRPTRRTISSNTSISVVENLVLIGGGGDSRNAHRWAIAWPKVTVRFSYLAAGTQIKMMPEQGGSPAGTLPTIQLALTELPTSDSMTWNWPNGWRLVDMPQEEIPGTDIRFTQEVWEWQQKVTV